MIKIIRAKQHLRLTSSRSNIWLHQRSFSSVTSSSDSEEQSESFPYIFMNQNGDLVKRKESTDERHLEYHKAIYEKYNLEKDLV